MRPLLPEGQQGAVQAGLNLTEVPHGFVGDAVVWGSDLARSGQTKLIELLTAMAARANIHGKDRGPSELHEDEVFALLGQVEEWREFTPGDDDWKWTFDKSIPAAMENVLSIPPYAQTHYLGFHLNKQEAGESKGKLTPYAQALMDAFTANRGLRWMYEESDSLAQDSVKGADPHAESFSIYAGRIAGLLLHQAEQLYPNLVEAKGPDAQAARLLGSHAMITESFLLAAVRQVAERDGQGPDQAAEALLKDIESRNKTGTFAEGERFSYHIGGDPENPDITIWYGDLELHLTTQDLIAIYLRGRVQATRTVHGNAEHLSGKGNDVQELRDTEEYLIWENKHSEYADSGI